MRTPWLSAAAAACLAVAPGQASAQAQGRPVVFVHGLGMDSNEWSAGASYLSGFGQLQINPIRPTLGSTQIYEVQADNLETAIAGYSNVVAVSHSNGGIVTRQYGRTRGSSSRITGHLAVGSLHQGAPLAANVINGAAAGYLSDLTNSVLAPIKYYYLNDHAFKDKMDANVLEAILYNSVADMMDNYTAAAIGVIVGVNLSAVIPVVPEMCPVNLYCPVTTYFMADLNSPSSLAAEASAFQQRISISTEVPPTNVWARGWCPTACPGIPAEVANFAMAEYTHYSSPDQPFQLQLGATMWLNLWIQMNSLDFNWLRLIGAVDNSGVYLPQDGLLPLTTQTYVGGTRHYRLQGSDIYHAEQPSNSLVLQTISSVLRNDFGIPRRIPPTVTVAPSSASLNVAQSVTLSVTARDYFGNVITDDPVAWASSNSAVATVSTAGVVTGVARGSATITATVEGVNGATTITVLAPSVSIGGPGYVAIKGTYQFPTTVLNITGPLTYTWGERFCGDETVASCTAWVSVPNVGSTYTRTLSKDCTGGGSKNFQLDVVVTGNQSAEGFHRTWSCIQ